jgi:FkbM family methyltransferase
MHRAWRFRRRSEPGPVRCVLEGLGEGDIAIDIGANRGAHTYWMCRRVGGGGRVIAVEPQPEWAEYLRSAGRAFRFDQLEVVESGLSSGAGVRDLVLPHDNPVGGASFEVATVSDGRHLSVSTLTLDALLDERGAHPVSLIKCDVEGHEYEVFLGGRQTLSRDRPTLVFECQNFRHPEGQIARVFGMLHELGYEGHYFGKRGALHPVDGFDPVVHQDRAGSVYFDNFVFRHTSTM